MEGERSSSIDSVAPNRKHPDHRKLEIWAGHVARRRRTVLCAPMRVALLALLAAPLAAQSAGPPLTPFAERKARTLLVETLPCLGCHELDGSGGRVAPSLTDVGSRRGAAYIRAIVEAPDRVVPGAAMPRTPMPASTRELIIRYLARTAPEGAAPASAPAVPVDGPEPDAPALYGKWCASCHGASGAGDGPNAPHLPVTPANHASADAMSVRSDDALFDAIAGGGVVMGKSPRMPAFGATLTPRQIRALVSYVRSLCSCVGPAWSREGVLF